MLEQFVFLCFYKAENASREDPFEDRCWSQNARHGMHKENMCRVWPARLHKSGWDCCSQSSGALIQNACNSALLRILQSCLLTSRCFSWNEDGNRVPERKARSCGGLLRHFFHDLQHTAVENTNGSRSLKPNRNWCLSGALWKWLDSTGCC